MTIHFGAVMTTPDTRRVPIFDFISDWYRSVANCTELSTLTRRLRMHTTMYTQARWVACLLEYEESNGCIHTSHDKALKEERVDICFDCDDNKLVPSKGCRSPPTTHQKWHASSYKHHMVEFCNGHGSLCSPMQKCNSVCLAWTMLHCVFESSPYTNTWDTLMWNGCIMVEVGSDSWKCLNSPIMTGQRLHV